MQKICQLNDLVPEAGVCALFNEEPVAVFYVPSAEPRIYAVSNLDPVSNQQVISHGLVCEISGALCVASPLYKDHFDLVTGQCLEKPELSLTVLDSQIREGWVYIAHKQIASAATG